jgi:hypothetical protein
MWIASTYGLLDLKTGDQHRTRTYGLSSLWNAFIFIFTTRLNMANLDGKYATEF